MRASAFLAPSITNRVKRIYAHTCVRLSIRMAAGGGQTLTIRPRIITQPELDLLLFLPVLHSAYPARRPYTERRIVFTGILFESFINIDLEWRTLVSDVYSKRDDSRIHTAFVSFATLYRLPLNHESQYLSISLFFQFTYITIHLALHCAFNLFVQQICSRSVSIPKRRVPNIISLKYCHCRNAEI